LNRILQDELANNYNRMEAYLKNGVVQSSDLDAVKVEQINAMQSETDLRSTLKSYCQMLSILRECKWMKTRHWKSRCFPFSKGIWRTGVPNCRCLMHRKICLKANGKPFLQEIFLKSVCLYRVVIGRPGLNFFDNSFTPFYIAGVRLSWNFGGLYTQKNDLAKIDINRKEVETQKETFLFNNSLLTTQQQNEIDKTHGNHEK